jgi:anthranilate/para-aminobenzoate synthase component I
LRGPLLRDVSWDLSRDAFCAAVRETHESIRAGDVYVLNLTARLEGESVADSPEEAFASLAARASADMAALVTGLPGAVPWIASVSPERFVRVRRAGSAATGARIVEIEPIKGTRPRGSDPSADAAIAEGLLADPKERAEHVMVVDMERNDLGIVCVPGSIHVDPLYEIVPTPYCHQLVSRVRGAMRPEATFAELLPAVFPCGSVTGAPKRSAIRIADGLEATPRGAYCGSLLVALPGELDSSVIIRTLEGIADKPERARYGAGCGITIDSDPDAEYEEAVLKASLVAGP